MLKLWDKPNLYRIDPNVTGINRSKSSMFFNLNRSVMSGSSKESYPKGEGDRGWNATKPEK